MTARVLSVAADGPLRPGGIGHTVTGACLSRRRRGRPRSAPWATTTPGAPSSPRWPRPGAGSTASRSPGRSPTARAAASTPTARRPACSTRRSTGPTSTDAQRQLVAAADVVVVMIGPAAVIRARRSTASRPEAAIAWIVKNDPAALPPELAAELRRRADIIFHNAAESSVVDGVPAAPRRSSCAPTGRVR